MADSLRVARSEFILGGQKSGKSRRAESLAQTWLATSPDHRAVLIATARAGDDEMQQRIARHQRDRAERVPGMITLEEPLKLAEAIQQHSTAATLLVVDCLTLWLTNGLMPVDSAESFTDSTTEKFMENQPVAQVNNEYIAMLLEAISHAAGPLVLVGNEIGLGVIPMGAQVRAFVDTLGTLNQQVAARCARVTLMAAGLPLILKDSA